ncbi:MAG: WYL domain-containing protein [Desulfobacteraceae bacterium]|nr:WYL domain-containing protein [Desulfobacteraceae bacterium]
MANYPIYERIVWFDRQVRNRKYPNASSLSTNFEIVLKTAQRNINFIRDRMGAPLEYDSLKRGYYYSDLTFSLPPLQADQEEMLALIIARNLLSQSAGGLISRSIQRLGKKLMSESTVPDLSEDTLDEMFSSSWTGYSPAPPETFKLCMNALLKRLCLAFDYTPPGAKAGIPRKVEPHHLQHYMGSWVLLAWCASRKDWRKFYLSRMNNVLIKEESFGPRPPTLWKHLIDSAFGIFQNQTSLTVTLRFSSFRAGWIKEQIWHPDQKMSPTPDGGLELSLPVSDFREIKMKILQFGADVEVLDPPALRWDVEEEIEKMIGLYKK